MFDKKLNSCSNYVAGLNVIMLQIMVEEVFDENGFPIISFADEIFNEKNVILFEEKSS